MDSVQIAYLAIELLSFMLGDMVFLMFEIYWLYRLHQFRKATIIQKRQPDILQISTISLLVYLLINSILNVLDALEIDGEPLNDIENNTTTFIYCFIALPLYWTFLWHSCARFWLLFFDIKWNVSCDRNKWHCLITGSKESRDFFLKERQRFGSYKWIRPRLILLILFCCIYTTIFGMLMVEKSVSATLFYFMCSLHFIVPLILYICILRMIPGFDDHIGLREELRFCIWCFFVIFTVWMLYLVFYGATYTLIEDETVQKLLWALCLLLTRIVTFLFNMKQTRWPLKRFQSVLETYSERKLLRLAHRNTLSGSSIEDGMDGIDGIDGFGDDSEREALSPGHTVSTGTTTRKKRGESITVDSQETSARTKMNMRLQDERVFDEFMTVLLREHCAECMLSVIEFVQFRDQIEEVIQKTESTFIRTQPDRNHFVLPYTDTFPRSGIVFGINSICGDEESEEHDSNELGDLAATDEMDSPSYTMVDYKKIARKLWNKYIRENSEFEININGKQRRKYRMLLSHEDQWMDNETYDTWNMLLELFDPCINEMMGLMTNAFLRWKSDPMEWTRVKKQLVTSFSSRDVSYK